MQSPVTYEEGIHKVFAAELISMNVMYYFANCVYILWTNQRPSFRLPGNLSLQFIIGRLQNKN